MRRYKNIEYKIQFRSWGYAKQLYKSFWKHLKSWCFGKWSNSNHCDIWLDSGFRILGLEFCKREWRNK